jgi:hypothetical protein
VSSLKSHKGRCVNFVLASLTKKAQKKLKSSANSALRNSGLKSSNEKAKAPGTTRADLLDLPTLKKSADVELKPRPPPTNGNGVKKSPSQPPIRKSSSQNLLDLTRSEKVVQEPKPNKKTAGPVKKSTSEDKLRSSSSKGEVKKPVAKSSASSESKKPKKTTLLPTQVKEPQD